MEASDKLGLSRLELETIGRLGSGSPDICGGAVVMLVHECGSGISIVQAMVRDISGVFCIFCMFDEFGISDARRVSDPTAFKPPTSMSGVCVSDRGICVGAGAEDGLAGIDCDGGWLWLLEGSGFCSFAVLAPASSFDSITGNF